jgi:DNA mismatch repair protein MutS
MLRQYHELKARYPGTLLMFRLGDFYELFYEDAQLAARVLEITLTSREVGKGSRIPMCGVPHHALDAYLARLVERGYRVAICDQLEDPALAKGLVKRDVVRVVTPGTVIDSAALPRGTNTYLAAVLPGEPQWGLAVCDLSTGEFQVGEIGGPDAAAAAAEELARLDPKEVLAPEDARELLSGLLGSRATITGLDRWRFDVSLGRAGLLAHFGVVSLDGFGCEHLPAAVAAAGALLQYLKDTQMSPLAHIRRMTTYALEDALVLDAATRRNLEVVRSLADGRTGGSLLGILDESLTGMGARKLRQWLLQPLRHREQIIRRLDAVDHLVQHPRLRESVRAALKGMGDLERLVGRAGHGSAAPRELVVLAAAVRKLPTLVELLRDAGVPLLETIRQAIGTHDEIAGLIERAIVDAPPAVLGDGGVIRDGFSSELDAIRSTARTGRSWIAEFEAVERARTGIKSLKVGFNKVFGYYIEISNANLPAVPPEYIRKQTLTTGERFITPDMKEHEAAILGAEERSAGLERDLYDGVRQTVARSADPLLLTARAVAELDALAALAEVAAAADYVRPEIIEEPVLEIHGGRHPVVERLVSDRFVPNDVHLSTADRAIVLVTGPNMAGKSTYLRQAALIVLMAQIGSFVPADRATIGLADRIFTRIGAVDDIATGRSTFLVEMQEVANILHHASLRSLIILDEVGRGTSTYDGMSIAWAVVEYLHDHIGARTLFATHYHELTELGALLPHVHNVNVLVQEEGDTVVFLRRVADGGADRSYGIHVARLAGLPPAVIDQAQRILRRLESSAGPAVAEDTFLPPIPSRALGAQQLPLPLNQLSPVEESLLTMSLESMTPLEAMGALHALIEQVRQRVAAGESGGRGKVVRMKRHMPKGRS